MTSFNNLISLFMTKKLNSMPDFRAKMPKSVHDVSAPLTFTTCPGMLSPVYFDMLHTGDKLHFSASQFTRLNPIEKPSLGEIDVHLDYFFVPLTVMYLPSSSLFYQTDDLVSSAFNKSTLKKDKFPVYNIAGFINQIFGTGDYYLDDALFDQDAQSALDQRFFDCLGKSVYRMFDFLEMNPNAILDKLAGTDFTYPAFTPWYALAYQAIYQMYYRNDDREHKNYHYNIDKFYNTTYIPTEITDSVKSIFQINYASRPKDYFNSVKVSPIGSSVSMLSGSVLSGLYSSVNDWLNNNGSFSVTADGDEVLPFGSSEVTQTGSSISSGYLTSNTVRQLFMVDKLLRVVGRAEKNYESQFLAHFGIKIPHDVMHNITHIGHDMISIKPEGLVSTSDTFNSTTGDGSALGEIGGQMNGMLTGQKRSFEAPFHGVFLVISHIVPKRRYITGLSKLHQFNAPNDFYQPEFDRKGMQPLFGYEYNPDKVGSEDTIGWQFAYEQFKRKYGRVTTAFVPSRNTSIAVNTLSPWIVANYPFHDIDYDGNAVDVSDDMAIAMLVSPNDLNTNCIVMHDGRWPSGVVSDNQYKPWLLYQTDPFICDFYLHCKKVNGMSEYGEPEL